jgi:hypothetical protein
MTRDKTINQENSGSVGKDKQYDEAEVVGR